MSRTAGFHADPARRQLREEDQDLVAAQPFAQNHGTGRIHPMNLKEALGQIQTDHRNRAHAGLPSQRIVDSL